MLSALPPGNEPERLRLLRSLGVLDAEPSVELDRITRIAARHFRLPIATVTLIDDERQWFASCVGLETCQTPRSVSFCAHAILSAEPLVVHDALSDPRFCDNPLVTGPPHIRFYAGQTIYSRAGLALGALCLIDTQPRTFDEGDRRMLSDLAAMAEQYFGAVELALEAGKAKAALARTEKLFSRAVTHAAVGIAIADPQGRWVEMNQRFCRLAGRSRERLLGSPWPDSVHAQDLALCEIPVQRLLQLGLEIADLELRFARDDGQDAWLQLAASAILDEGGQVEHVMVVVSDISEHKQLEQELQSLTATLEQQVRARTADLHQSVEHLHREVARREATQRELLEETERFQSILEDTSDAFVEIDAAGHIASWNAAAVRIFGWTREEALGRSLVQTVVPGENQAACQKELQRIVDTGRGKWLHQRVEMTGKRRDGSSFPLELALGTNRKGGRRLVYAFLHDITRRKADEDALLESERRLKTIADNVPALIAYVDQDFRYQFHNAIYHRWFAIPEQGLVGTDARDFWGAAIFEQITPALEQVFRGETVTVEYQRESRRGLRWFQCSLVPRLESNDRVAGFYLLAEDVTEHKQMYQRLEHESLHDALTGLPNRRALMRRLKEAIARAQRHGKSLAVLFMDLDGFKRLNDSLGHEFGDSVLVHFATTVSAIMRETDFLARLAGDEFVAVLEDLPSAQRVMEIVQAITQRIEAQKSQWGVNQPLSTSIGVALYDNDRRDSAGKLLARADAAMYLEKERKQRAVG
jgi:diguanylate cyclase (GGDEF)-like protein/PAS domain S-box-containing protein